MIQHAPCQNQTLQPKSFQITQDWCKKYIGLSVTVGGGKGGCSGYCLPPLYLCEKNECHPMCSIIFRKRNNKTSSRALPIDGIKGMACFGFSGL